MSKMNLALLSDEVVDTEVSDEAATAAVTEVAEGPDADLAAMDDAAGDIEAAGAVIDEADATTEVLDQVGDKLEEAEKDGGLTAPAAEAIRICLEHMGARLGIPAPASLAAEGFASKSNRARTTRLARESVGEWAKKIWDMLVKAYEKVKEFVIKWFKNFFDGATKLKNRAEKLKKAAEAKVTAGAKVDAKDAKIVNPAYGTTLTTGGKVASARMIAAILMVYKSDNQSKKAEEAIQFSCDSVEEMLGVIDKPDEFKNLVKDLLNSYEALPVIKPRGKKLDANVTYHHLGNGKVVDSLGDWWMYLQIPKTGETIDRLQGIKVIAARDESNGVSINTAMVAANPAEVVDIADACSEVSDQLTENKNLVADFGKNIDSIISALKRAKGNYEGDAKDRVSLIAKAAKVTNAIMVKGSIMRDNHYLRTANAAITYGAESLNKAKAS